VGQPKQICPTRIKHEKGLFLMNNLIRTLVSAEAIRRLICLGQRTVVPFFKFSNNLLKSCDWSIVCFLEVISSTLFAIEIKHKSAPPFLDYITVPGFKNLKKCAGSSTNFTPWEVSIQNFIYTGNFLFNRNILR
jgi:hypothetical protein